MKKIFLLLQVLCFSLSLPSISLSQEPIALLLVTKGLVEHSNDGIKWNKVTGSKFIYEGDHVKTGKNSKCSLINQKNFSCKLMEANSEIVAQNENIQTVSGSISKLNNDSNNLIKGMQHKYAKMKEYSAVSRSVNRKMRVKLFTVEKLTLSNDYPDIVWENIGSEFSYTLIIDNKKFSIPASENEIVRFQIPAMEPGEYNYSVNVFRKGKKVFSSKKKNLLRWQSLDEMKDCRKDLNSITAMGDKGFLKGNYFDNKGLKVAAMDSYKDFFNNNPDNNEMRPFLIKVYHDLKLKELRKSLDLLYQNNRL